MTPLLAATATRLADVPPWLILAAGVALAVPVYALCCWWRPFARCWCCRGRGVHARKDGKVWRVCLICKGRKGYLRVGRRIHNYFASARSRSL